ncbi:putative G-protein coupled receptor 160 [Rhinoraja longicauda]
MVGDPSKLISCNDCIRIDSRLYIFQMSNSMDLLLVILFAKVILNIIILSMKRRMLQSLIGHFCISLALMDVALFACVIITSFVNNQGTFGAPISFHHVCGLLQFFSHVYSILHFPLCLMSGIDYFVHLRNLSKSLGLFRKMLYIFTVCFLWIGAILHTLYNHGFKPLPLATMQDFPLNQCEIPISTQSLLLSAMILSTLCVVTIYCWPNITALVRSLHIDTYLEEIVMWSSHPAAQLQAMSSKKQVLTNVIICFALTWMPFILLQLTIVLIWAPLPAYMDLNIPWLCFINSFLIGIIYWMNYKDIPPEDISLIPDGFCHWECCKLQQVPFNCKGKWVPDNEVKASNILIA